MQTIRRELRQKFIQVLNDNQQKTAEEIAELLADSALTVAGIKKAPEGLPQPTGDHLGDWLKVEQSFKDKNQPYIDLLEVLSSEFKYNFPKFGESRDLDRVVKLIVKDGRDIKKFISWAKDKKRDPHWYHLKPDTMWGDFPQAFAPEADNSIRARLERERNNATT